MKFFSIQHQSSLSDAKWWFVAVLGLALLTTLPVFASSNVQKLVNGNGNYASACPAQITVDSEHLGNSSITGNSAETFWDTTWCETTDWEFSDASIYGDSYTRSRCTKFAAPGMVTMVQIEESKPSIGCALGDCPLWMFRVMASDRIVTGLRLLNDGAYQLYKMTDFRANKSAREIAGPDRSELLINCRYSK
jgi:hypothetical protein